MEELGMMQPAERPPRRVLVMMAHPDDPEFTAGGTIARWVNDGAWVGYVICTAGDKGSEDRSLPAALLARTREAEQRAAGRMLGVQAFEFLGYEDGGLQHTLQLRCDLVRAIRRHRPDTVLCFEPSTRYLGSYYVQHPDHYLSGEAVLAAIYPAARNARTFPELLDEGLEPHVVEQVYMAATNTPDRWIDIEATFEAKVAAMQRHGSQAGDGGDLAGFLRLLAAEAGRTARPAPLRLAEPFRYLNSMGG
jgi:LmbE family N-acetylglucosaminyl deacetylase